MRLLVHSGFFSLQSIKHLHLGNGEEEQGYALTPPSKLLLTGTATDMSPFLLMMVEPVQMDPLHYLSTWFKGGDRTAFEIANGACMWELETKDPKLNDMFNDAMASDARLAMGVVVKECAQVFQGLRSLVDVGGGNGAAAEVIANAFPDLKCSVFDLPHVVASAPKRENVSMIGGNMHESIPSADALFLKWNLHGFNDEESFKILKRCKEAIPSREEGGKVIILEIVVNKTNGHPKEFEMQLFLDMMMLISSPGKERDENEWRKLFVEAGFTDCKITPVLGLRSIIEWVLHNWGDDLCVKILRNWCKALPDPGKVIIIEFVLQYDDGINKTGPLPAISSEVWMIVNFDGGKERSLGEFETLAKMSGFCEIKAFPMSIYGLAAIEFYKAPQ
ncbi:hypothetical protein ACLOJK_009575 [Asimina triloba]